MTRQLTLLLLEDEALVRMAMADMLEDLGHVSSEAGKIADARRRLESTSFDVLIADINLPDGSGIEFVSEIQNDYPEMAIIISSGYEGSRARDEDFICLPKPYDEQMLAQALERALHQARQRRPLNGRGVEFRS